MSNRFEVQVVALDRFTAVFRRLNDASSRAVRPLTNVQRQVGALAKEMHLDKIAKGMGTVSRSSLAVARNLGALTAPMEALFGLGAAGSIAGIGAAVVGLGARWGNLGFEVNRTAASIGVSTQDLQRYRGAATLAGLSSEGLTGSLRNLGDTLQDALYGRNQQALIILNKLGIPIKKTADGVVDSAAAFNDLALALSKISDPHTQAIIARAFGIEDMLPLLRQGPAAIKALTDQAEKFGMVANGQALDGAQKFTESLNRLKGAAEGLANTWGAKITPMLTRGMDMTTNSLTTGGFWSAMGDVFSGRLSRQFWFGGAGASGARSAAGATGGWDSSAANGSQPLGLRQNNPGNLRSWQGVPSANGFASFASPAEGLNAMAQQLNRYQTKYGLNTLSGILNRYAPSSENDTGAYIASVSKQTGFDPNAQLNTSDPKVLVPLLSAMIKHEQGRQPFSNEQLAAAAQTVKVEVAFANAPPGTQAQAKAGAGASAAYLPTRISYSMPTGSP